MQAPFVRDQYTNAIRRTMGLLGLDFLIAISKFLHGQLDFALEGVVSETMSSTGMVTFLDLSSVACAASAPLTVKASVLNVSVAPEPREIIWENSHVSKKTQAHREAISNAVLFVGVVLWSFPLTFIQAVAKVEFLAQLPGMEWLSDYIGGNFSHFVNGYLPVVALLGLIMILPVIFEYIAVKYEHRKTLSEVQASMLGRYFNYQLVNIYVTVTAGSLLVKVADIANHPMSILFMGESLPRMAGYFVALLVTKILAGLPMIFLRFGALMRMLFLKLLSNERKLTQREVDSVYRLENVQYGWEFPTQLLVVVIVFTYAIMCPVILPVGMIYFMGALIVYKKQILYVYSPVYESGGALFPLAVQRTLFGLVCAQVLFLGYIVTRGGRNQSIFLAPLPVLTVMTSNYFKKTYADPSKRLSLERARAFDQPFAPDSSVESQKAKFDKNFYRQPVLTEVFREPWTYRRGFRDEETIRVREELRRTNRFITQTQMQNVFGVLKAMRSNLSLNE
jgi:Calcium-dependent channel, 7TM region, putative phosphate